MIVSLAIAGMALLAMAHAVDEAATYERMGRAPQIESHGKFGETVVPMDRRATVQLVGAAHRSTVSALQDGLRTGAPDTRRLRSNAGAALD